jgi:hypothetical protein
VGVHRRPTGLFSDLDQASVSAAAAEARAAGLETSAVAAMSATETRS